jgi:hypothetical protein
MNIKAFFTRNVKKNNSSTMSTSTKNVFHNDASNDAESAETQKMKELAREERRLQKLARQEKKQMRLERKEERLEKIQRRLAKKEGRLAKREMDKMAAGDNVPRPDDEVSNSSSTPSRPGLGNRRTALRADLKDKYSDILNNQPRVHLTDVVDEYFKGLYDFYTWKFFDRCMTRPKIVLDRS